MEAQSIEAKSRKKKSSFLGRIRVFFKAGSRKRKGCLDNQSLKAFEDNENRVIKAPNHLAETTNDPQLRNKIQVESTICNHSRIDISENIYAEDIFSYLRTYEEKSPVLESFVEKQRHLNLDMRIVVVDWMIGVHAFFQYNPNTLHTAISLFDRTLRVKHIKKEKLQLLGATCLFVAAKYEEMKAPKIANYVYITKKTYTVKQICKMEQHILSSVDFKLSYPKTMDFLPYFGLPSDDEQVQQLAKCMIEICMLESRVASLQPSLTAYAALMFARTALGIKVEVQLEAPYDVYEDYDLNDALTMLRNAFDMASKSALRNSRKKLTKYLVNPIIIFL